MKEDIIQKVVIKYVTSKYIGQIWFFDYTHDNSRLVDQFETGQMKVSVFNFIFANIIQVERRITFVIHLVHSKNASKNVENTSFDVYILTPNGKSMAQENYDAKGDLILQSTCYDAGTLQSYKFNDLPSTKDFKPLLVSN